MWCAAAGSFGSAISATSAHGEVTTLQSLELTVSILLLLLLVLAFTRCTMSQYTLLCTKAISEPALDKLRKFFKTVHYFVNDEPISSEILGSTEILFTGGGKLTKHIKSLDDLPKLKHIQMGSAGANGVLGSDQMKEYLESIKGEAEGGRFGLAGASGTHVLSIPNYVVGTIITLYHQLHTQIIVARVSCRAMLVTEGLMTDQSKVVERGRP